MVGGRRGESRSPVRAGLRGRLLFEGVGDGLLQGHRAALGPGGRERFVAE
jgi:hypothetical protein